MKKNKLPEEILTLYTPRLTIRKIEKSDALFIYQLRSDEKNMEYVEMKPYENMQRAESFIDHVTRDMEKQEVFFWGIETKDDQIKVGTICLWSFSKEMKSAEIGYELQRAYQKKGYANEALSAVISFARNKLALDVIDAITHERHQGSIQLLLKNDFKVLGYVHELMPDAKDGREMKLFRKSL